MRGFKVEHVFEERQLEDGRPVPEPVRPVVLTGLGPKGAWDALAGLVEAQAFQVERGSLAPANGLTNLASRRVTVSASLEEAAATKTLAHELAHVMMHQPGQFAYQANRGRAEAETESVAYLVLGELGLGTDAYSFPYVAAWSDGDIKVVTAAVERALATAEQILVALERREEALAA